MSPWPGHRVLRVEDVGVGLQHLGADNLGCLFTYTVERTTMILMNTKMQLIMSSSVDPALLKPALGTVPAADWSAQRGAVGGAAAAWLSRPGLCPPLAGTVSVKQPGSAQQTVSLGPCCHSRSRLALAVL